MTLRIKFYDARQYEYQEYINTEPRIPFSIIKQILPPNHHDKKNFTFVHNESLLTPNTFQVYDHIRTHITPDNIKDLLHEAFFNQNCAFFEFLILLPLVRELRHALIKEELGITERSIEFINNCPCLQLIFRLYQNTTYAHYHFCPITNLHNHCRHK